MLSPMFVFHKSENFTSDNWVQTSPTIPINHYRTPRNQQNGSTILFYYPMLIYSMAITACFEHSNFFKVNEPDPHCTYRYMQCFSSINWITEVRNWQGRTLQSVHTLSADQAASAPRSNYELFNCNNFNIRYWSWNYRGCWHQTRPPIVTRWSV